MHSQGDGPLQTPRLKRGAWIAFSMTTAMLKSETARPRSMLPLCSSRPFLFSNRPPVVALGWTMASAADAFADASSCGVGGWWCPSQVVQSPDTAWWFSIQFRTEDLPAWLRSENLQAFIASFEALAQLLPLLGRLRHLAHPGNAMVVLQQLCDNDGVAALTRKQLTMKAPLRHVLQAIGSYCCPYGISLSSQHCAGVCNEWADALSRGACEKCNVAEWVPRGAAK